MRRGRPEAREAVIASLARAGVPLRSEGWGVSSCQAALGTALCPGDALKGATSESLSHPGGHLPSRVWVQL